MKKVFAIVLVLCLGISMCSCIRKISPDDAATAPTLDITAYESLLAANVLQAEEQYDKKLFKVTGTVVEIDTMSCTLGEFDSSNAFLSTTKDLTVYLDKDILITLEKGKTYTFAGIFHTTENAIFLPSLKPAILITD